MPGRRERLLQGSMEAVEASAKIGYPVLVRAAFALSGLGSGSTAHKKELRRLVEVALVDDNPQGIVNESLRFGKCSNTRP